MESDTEVVERKDYNQLKKEVVSSFEDGVAQYVWQEFKTTDITKTLAGDTAFLKKVRDYFEEETGRLSVEKIQELLAEEDAVQMFREVSGKIDVCYLGLFRLETLTDRDVKKLSRNDDFWNWAKFVTSRFPYPLQNEKIDAVILEGMAADSKFTFDRFSTIIQIVTANASSESLEIFEHVIKNLTANDKKRLLESDASFEKRRNELYTKVDTVFKSIFKILETHRNNNSFKFYFEMNPKYIKAICASVKDISGDGNMLKWEEPLLQNLLSYYVHCAKNYRFNTDITVLWENSKLNEVFETVFLYSDNAGIQQNILNSYSADNEFLPYLPLMLIRNVMRLDDEGQKRRIIAYLENRYAISSPGERKEIAELNDSIVLDTALSMEVRNAAFSWYFNRLGEAGEAARKKWAAMVFNRFLAETVSDADSQNVSYMDMMRACFDVILAADGVSPDLISFTIRTENADLAMECLEKLFKSDKAVVKLILPRLWETGITEKRQKRVLYCARKAFFDMTVDSELSGIQEKTLFQFVELYKKGHLQVEIQDLFSQVVASPVVSESIKKRALDMFQGCCRSPEQWTGFQRNILSSYSPESKSLPHFPLGLLLDMLMQNSEEQKKRIVSYLEHRYITSPDSERKELIELHDAAILDQGLHIDVRNSAFSWYFSILSESDKLEKIRWTTNVFNKLITADITRDVSRSDSYVNMMRCCFTAVFSDAPNSPDLVTFIIKTDNPSLSKECLAKLYETDKSVIKRVVPKIWEKGVRDDKQELLLYCIRKTFFDMPTDAELPGIQEKGLEHLTDMYKSGYLKVDVRNLFSEIVLSPRVSEPLKKRAFELLYDVCTPDERRKFFADTIERLIDADEQGELFVFSLIKRFFAAGLDDTLVDKAQYCVKYCWKHKNCDGFIKDKNTFLDGISSCEKPDVIRYALGMSWN